MKLRWTYQARQDLIEIGRYIALDKPIAARRWVARLREQARQAAEMPMAGRRVPEVDRDDVREVILRGCRVVYIIRGSEVHILTVFEGHKRLPQEVVDSLG